MLEPSSDYLKSMSEMPGPEEIKGKGHVTEDLAIFQIKMHEKYGAYVRFKLDPDTVVVSTTDVDALRKCAKIFNKPEKLYHFLEPLMGRLMFLPLQENKALRSLTTQKFSPTLVEKHFDLLTKQLESEIDEWIRSAQSTAGIIYIQERTKALAMRMTVALVSGQDSSESKALGLSMHRALEELLKLQYDPSYKEQAALAKELSYINAQVEQMIRARQTLKKPSEKTVFLDEVLQTYQEPTEIANIVKEILMAGYHTVASSVAWTLFAIAKYPEVSKKLYHEIDVQLKSKAFQYNDLKKLGYLNQVLQESSRRYTVGPYTAREADNDLEIGGYLIPKGTTIFYPIWAVHMDPTYWPEPEKFDPERFSRSRQKTTFMPYGFGVRDCPGRNIANMQIMLILAKILQRLSLQAAPNFEPQIRENFVLISGNDIQLKVKPRKKNRCEIYFNKRSFVFLLLASLLIQPKNSLILFFIGIVAFYTYRNNNLKTLTSSGSYPLTLQPPRKPEQDKNTQPQDFTTKKIN